MYCKVENLTRLKGNSNKMYFSFLLTVPSHQFKRAVSGMYDLWSEVHHIRFLIFKLTSELLAAIQYSYPLKNKKHALSFEDGLQMNSELFHKSSKAKRSASIPIDRDGLQIPFADFPNNKTASANRKNGVPLRGLQRRISPLGNLSSICGRKSIFCIELVRTLNCR